MGEYPAVVHRSMHQTIPNVVDPREEANWFVEYETRMYRTEGSRVHFGMGLGSRDNLSWNADSSLLKEGTFVPDELVEAESTVIIYMNLPAYSLRTRTSS